MKNEEEYGGGFIRKRFNTKFPTIDWSGIFHGFYLAVSLFLLGEFVKNNEVSNALIYKTEPNHICND